MAQTNILDKIGCKYVQEEQSYEFFKLSGEGWFFKNDRINFKYEFYRCA